MENRNFRKMLGIQLVPPDAETINSLLYTYLPWAGSEAYLHTIFRPADDALLAQIGEGIRIPDLWRAVLKVQNGSNLFHDSLYVYGVVAAGDLKRRTSSDRVPFSIEEMNESKRFSPQSEWLLIGNYGYSGSIVLMSRADGRVVAMNQSGEKTLAAWPSVDAWLDNELKRLSVLFDPQGRLLTDERFSDPVHLARVT
jgi:hypothetical protein